VLIIRRPTKNLGQRRRNIAPLVHNAAVIAPLLLKRTEKGVAPRGRRA
jgi:hypothetical protein